MNKSLDANSQTATAGFLDALLDSYAICETEMNREMADEELARGQSVACAKGCFQCCLNQDIHISSPESLGISWYVATVMGDVEREKLYERLENRDNIIGCSFLIDGACSVHPARPFGCRKFVVYDRQCTAEDGDPFFSRPEDMHPSISERNLRIAMCFLESPIYDLTTEAARLEAHKNGLMHESSSPIDSINWLGFFAATRDLVLQEPVRPLPGATHKG